MEQQSIESLTSTVASLQAELQETRARLAALEAERAAPPPVAVGDRRAFLRTVGVGLAAAAGATVGTAAPAAAATDDPVLAGRTTEATGTARTAIGNASGTVLQPITFQASNDTNVDAVIPSSYRIAAAGTTTGSDATNGTRVGVYGHVVPSGYGVLGRAGTAPESALGGNQVGVSGTARSTTAAEHPMGGAFRAVAEGAGANSQSIGVRADAEGNNSYGLIASGETVGVFAYGVTALHLQGNGFQGAVIYQQTRNEVGPFPSRDSRRGEQLRDTNGDLWLCTVSGTPGTWRKAAAQHPSYSNAGGPINLLASPVRVVDTRNPGAQNNNGQRLAAGVDVTFQITGLGVFGVPAGATGVVGNATVVAPSGQGFLSIFPSTFANTSNLNYIPNQNLANSFVCALTPAGKLTVRSGSASTHLILDIAGFMY